MQELEKVLEEIDAIKTGFDTECASECDFFDWSCGACVGECDEYIKEKVKEIIRNHMNDGWIPVEERLPEESLNSVIGWDELRERCCFVQYYGGKWSLRADREPIKITHWRPIPDRPADKTEAPDWRESMLRKFDRRA